MVAGAGDALNFMLHSSSSSTFSLALCRSKSAADLDLVGAFCDSRTVILNDFGTVTRYRQPSSANFVRDLLLTRKRLVFEPSLIQRSSSDKLAKYRSRASSLIFWRSFSNFSLRCFSLSIRVDFRCGLPVRSRFRGGARRALNGGRMTSSKVVVIRSPANLLWLLVVRV